VDRYSVAFLRFSELKNIETNGSVSNAMPSDTAKANGFKAGVMYSYPA
jgi:hypothetical protein